MVASHQIKSFEVHVGYKPRAVHSVRDKKVLGDLLALVNFSSRITYSYVFQGGEGVHPKVWNEKNLKIQFDFTTFSFSTYRFCFQIVKASEFPRSFSLRVPAHPSPPPPGSGFAGVPYTVTRPLTSLLICVPLMKIPSSGHVSVLYFIYTCLKHITEC